MQTEDGSDVELEVSESTCPFCSKEILQERETFLFVVVCNQCGESRYHESCLEEYARSGKGRRVISGNTKKKDRVMPMAVNARTDRIESRIGGCQKDRRQFFPRSTLLWGACVRCEGSSWVAPRTQSIDRVSCSKVDFRSRIDIAGVSMSNFMESVLTVSHYHGFAEF
ncbi:hypothetical protein BSKO_10867 [Bryopsis sp. KO-2023]|nr:hypothetical protein BSKO_10867 [Bryopsis sp. KO-2023]